MTFKSIVLTFGFVFTGWITIMAGVMYFTDAAPAAVVIFPSDQVVDNLGDVSILSAGKATITLQSKEERFARRLYQSGAWLVLPAGLVGCLPLPKGEPRGTKSPVGTY
jgi:hypothetical protein